jgi:phenolic acid decarboxylase
VIFSVGSSRSTQTTYTEGEHESYTYVLDEGYSYSDTENYSFSTQNTHTGAVCRRYVGDDKYLVVTLFVYRMTQDGMEGESVTVRINLNDPNLTRGVIYGR